MELYLLICSLITETMKLFHGFHFLTTLRAVRDIEDSGKPKSTGTTYYIANIIFLAYIVQE